MEIAKRTEITTSEEENHDQLSVQLKKAMEEAEISNEQVFLMKLDQESFLHTICHDLRGPINNIEGISELLKDSLAKENIEEIKSLLGYMQHSVKQMGTLIQEITDLRKKNLTPPPSESVDLAELIDGAYLLLEDEIRRSGFSITSNLQLTELPYNKKNLRCMIFAVLANALKHGTSRRNLLVEIRSFEDQEFYILAIQDSGTGISKEITDKVFTKKIHASYLKEGDTGLNLFVINKMLESGGGKLEIHNNNKGTEVLMFIKKEIAQ